MSDPAAPAPPPPPPPAGAGLGLGGRFELLQEIGSGSSGTVYRARLGKPYGELPAGAEVAIKFLRRELADDEKARARLAAEGELGQSVRHPNVAAIHGAESFEVLGQRVTYLVMQYVQGTTLRELLKRSGPPVEDLTRRIGADAAKGLHALHRRGVVHRDVKPENLILTPDSELKIVDLGLARPFGSTGRGSESSAERSSGLGLAGSVAYSAPESLRGEPAGPRSDLYSLGVVLFEITTGKHPFAGRLAVDEMLDAHLHQPPPRPSHLRSRVSPFLEKLLLDLLQKDPSQRPRDAAELARILEQGEHSEYWRRHEARAPALASQRRLLRLRRPAETAFYGRQDELLQLEQQWQRTRFGHGGLAVVAGPQGIGRRRLLDEALQRWLGEDEPPLLLGGEADSHLGHGEPFASALLDLLLRGDDRSSPNAAARAAEAARRLFALSEPDAEALAAVALGHSTEPPEVRADRLASALLLLPRKGRPLLVRIDHAERLDTSGRLVLQRLAAACRNRPLLLLLAAGLEALPVEPTLRLDLGGLGEAEFLAFGRELCRSGEPVEEFLRAAHQVLSGLPGNLLESLDHLAQEGLLQGRPGDYHDLQPGTEPRPAPGHVARFHRRVAALAPQQRAVLAAAAVLGERCSLGLLAALVQATELAVLETLSLFRGRIVRAQGGEVSFRHRDFQKAILRELQPEERQRLHRAAAALLQQQGEGALAVGMHLSQALDHEGCLDPLLDGLDERVRAGSRRTALRIAGRVQVHLQQVPDTQANQRRRLRWLLLAGQARANADQAEAASRWFRDAEALARQLGDLEASATARTGIAAGELDSGRLLAAIAILEGVHDDLAERHTPPADALAARAHGLHGRILLYRGEATDGLRHLHAALRRLPPAQADLRCHLLIDLARVEALSHHYPTALKTLQKVEQEPSARHLPRVRMRLCLYRGQIRAVLGHDEAVQDLLAAIEEAERLSLPVYAARAALFLGERAFWRRRDDDARLWFGRAVAYARQGPDPLGEVMARCYLRRLGAADPELRARVEALAMPSVQANWLLAELAAGGDDAAADPAARQALADLVAASDLPLSLHLRALGCLDRPAQARAVVRTIAERFPGRTERRRFAAAWEGGARV